MIPYTCAGLNHDVVAPTDRFRDAGRGDGHPGLVVLRLGRDAHSMAASLSGLAKIPRKERLACASTRHCNVVCSASSLTAQYRLGRMM